MMMKDDELSKASTRLSQARDNGLLDIIKKVHPRHVIWALLMAIFCLLAFIGKKYDTRLEGLEQHRQEQNGRLHSIDLKLEAQSTDIRWIKVKLGGND